MSYLLFIDESGHDHKNTPYEVRGGVAVQDSELWPFVQGVRGLEVECFGAPLHEYKTELKGARLLEKKRFRWARQDAAISPVERRALCRAFLTKGLEKRERTRREFTAYGQACLCMAQQLFLLLAKHRAELFAVAIPRGAEKPRTDEAEEYLRKDHVFLLERYFYFLEKQNDYGLIVMDESDEREDRGFVGRLERYFTVTEMGRQRTARIVPTPFFVSSEMTYPVQVADVCIYCVNWSYRLPQQGMNAPVREELADLCRESLYRLQFVGDGYRDRKVFRTYGIVYVPNPYGPGRT